MFDWFVSLAIKHKASSLLEGADEREDNVLAARMALQMALSVAANFGRLLLHETVHNLGPWHCAEREGLDGEIRMGCLQDRVAYAWWAHALARLGLTSTTHVLSTPLESKASVDGTVATGYLGYSYVYWDISLGLDAAVDHDESRRTGEISTEFLEEAMCSATVFADPMASRRIQPYFIEAEIECRQGSVSDDLGAFYSILETLGARDLAESITLDTKSDGDMRFTIDRPLEGGASIAFCCFERLDPGCVTSAVQPARVVCWSSDAPEGYRGCCGCPDITTELPTSANSLSTVARTHGKSVGTLVVRPKQSVSAGPTSRQA